VRCRQLGRPVIVASHLLQSMIEFPTPTRAEARGPCPTGFAAISCLLRSMIDFPRRVKARAPQGLQPLRACCSPRLG